MLISDNVLFVMTRIQIPAPPLFGCCPWARNGASLSLSFLLCKDGVAVGSSS